MASDKDVANCPVTATLDKQKENHAQEALHREPTLLQKHHHNYHIDVKEPSPTRSPPVQKFRQHSIPAMHLLEVPSSCYESKRNTGHVLSVSPRHSKEDFQKMAKIGSGAFGSVYLVKRKNLSHNLTPLKNPGSFAMKVISKREIKQTKTAGSLILEKRILTELRNDFIIKLKCSFQDRMNCYMVMEYAEGGDLYSFLHNPNTPRKVEMFKELGQNGVRFVIGCVILALQSLHSLNIMYRDLKPENVLIFEDGYAKLTDFGLAGQAEGEGFHSELAGTRVYLAPQVVEDGKYTKLIDLWALGVFLHEMILMVPPYDVMYIAYRRFKKVCLREEKERKWKPGNISEEAKDLIQRLLRVDPKSRLGAMGFHQIKQHPFFEGFDWEALRTRKMKSPLLNIINQLGPSLPIERIFTSEDNHIHEVHDDEQHHVPELENFEHFQHEEHCEECGSPPKIGK